MDLHVEIGKFNWETVRLYQGEQTKLQTEKAKKDHQNHDFNYNIKYLGELFPEIGFKFF